MNLWVDYYIHYTYRWAHVTQDIEKILDMSNLRKKSMRESKKLIFGIKQSRLSELSGYRLVYGLGS